MFDFILLMVAFYALIGVVASGVLVSVGLKRIDPVLRSSSLGVRLLIFPGCVALWPIMLFKWVSVERKSA